MPTQLWNAEPYLRCLAADCNRLRLSVIDPKYVKTGGEARLTLAQVYTDLDVTALVDADKGKRTSRAASRRRAPSDMLERETRRMTVIEAVADPKQPRVALLGGPGGGKTTILAEVSRDHFTSNVHLYYDGAHLAFTRGG